MSQLPGFAVSRRALAFLFLILSWGSLAHAQEAFTVDVPGATFTRVIGLNAQGDVCGGTQVDGVRLGFVRPSNGDFTDVRRSRIQRPVFTQCRGINAAGQLVGAYQSADGVFHAFIKDGPEFLSIDAPGAVDTRGVGIGPRGQIVGRYTLPDQSSTGSSGAAMGPSSPSTRQSNRNRGLGSYATR